MEKTLDTEAAGVVVNEASESIAELGELHLTLIGGGIGETVL